jgi:2-hydroxychromene-2-carboxylate isomerase
MGDLIVLSERLADRSRPGRNALPAFFFDVACPFSYLAAERIERLLGVVEWVPASGAALREGAAPAQPPNRGRLEAERRAAELRLPLVWPDGFPGDAPGALRAAAHAARMGAGPRFALAAMRLAFCGGFDLEDPEILAEAAAAAGILLDDCFSAIGDESIDESLNATGRGLSMRGVGQLPAVRVGHAWFDGEHRMTEAAAMLRAPAVYGKPLAPVG